MCDDYPKGVMFKGRFYVLGGGAIHQCIESISKKCNPKSQQNTEGR